MKAYRGSKRQEISFPLGGIGSGCVGLDGTGRLVDWEIFNHPDKGTLNGFSHFGIKAESDGRTVDARVLNSDLLGSHMGRYVERRGHFGYGYGPGRELLSGVPHFRDSVFCGEFPKARVEFADETFPGQVSLEAFNPLIPSNDADSSIPAAFFTAEVTNNGDAALTYTFEFTVNNPSKRPHVHSDLGTAHFTGVELADDSPDADDPEWGRLIFGVPAGDVPQIQHYWYRGNWFDNLGIFWQDFTAPGPLRERVYAPYSSAGEDLATVAVTKTVAPGETWRQRFLLGWFYPNRRNDWSDAPETDRRPWKNYYAVLFPDVNALAEYALGEWDRLEAETDRFRAALYGSSLPEAAMEAVGANLAVLKSPTVLRLTDGSFYGFEGCACHEGSCEGSCTHVWNYAHALPFLFPNLERSMRELDYTYNLGPDGGMAFRLQLPLGSARWRFRPCVDGQMGGVIKTYREWKLSGDDAWLKKWWPGVKKSLEYAWSPANADRWDPERTGVITGRQHHTLDMELFGPNSWLNSFYLGALKAGAEMAEAMGEPDAAAEYLRLYEQGRAYTDRELFNGEYYFQKIDVRDRSVLAPFAAGDTLVGGTTADTYWSDEAGQIKYQIAGGCIVDQVLGQWMCELAGVGEILDPAHVRSALDAIFRHNFKPSLRFHFNPCRIYGLNDESGLTICDWPEGVEKPVVPVPYAEESMHGFEYQAATHMIRHGLVDEGLRVVQGIRDRYDGEYRNPWNEMECGSNYARSMASYALLLSWSGFSFDMRRGRLGFAPMCEGAFFWSCDGAWGTFRWEEGKARLDVLYGAVTLRRLGVPNVGAKARLNGEALACTADGGDVCFDAPLALEAGAVLEIG